MKDMSLALPARMNLVPEGFGNLDVAVLDLPYATAIADFCQSIKWVLGEEIWFPYRQLNAALLACAPTLTHGFEHYASQQHIKLYRALAVGTPASPLRLPSTSAIHWMLKTWANEWVREYRGKRNGEADTVCDQLLNVIAEQPPEWEWEQLSPDLFFKDVGVKRGLGYEAIPALLAALLNGKTCMIRFEGREQVITWQKVVGSTANRTGLYVVSQPFYDHFVDRKGQVKEGCFAYRLDFVVQTQAGRFNEHGFLRPWVFLQLSCQRYAHEPLKQANFRRRVSTLVRVDLPRLDSFDVDTTLVRLPFKFQKENSEWGHGLERYLRALKARPLEAPVAIQQDPLTYANIRNDPAWRGDEYYIVHAEGLKYSSGRGGGHGHPVTTGYDFEERAAIVACVLDQLAGVLIPDDPLTCDIPTPKGIKTPLAMRDYDYLDNHPDTHIELIAQALKRVQDSQSSSPHIFIIWRERETRDALLRQVHSVFGVRPEDSHPGLARITMIYLDDAGLLQPLDAGKLRGKAAQDELIRQHTLKRQAWQNFLRRAAPSNDANPLALIEIGRPLGRNEHMKRSIHAAVRDACARQGTSSQMLQTIDPDPSEPGKYKKGHKSRAENAVRDLIIRQQGLLFGPPTDVYHRAGLPSPLAEEMDIIAFCRRSTTTMHGDIHYALAIRLSAAGAVHILMPGEKIWIPYGEAGPVVGSLFAEARADRWVKGHRDNSKIKLNYSQLASFLASTITTKVSRPTLFVIEADVWRNGRPNTDKIWPQLQNEWLSKDQDVLNFAHLSNYSRYLRGDPTLSMILGVVRLRTGLETPQYIANKARWDDDTLSNDFRNLSGFYDQTDGALLHYFSVGRTPVTQKAQRTSGVRGRYKLALNYAFKHQRMLELVPFFVRHDFRNLKGQLSLCRSLHYLRTSPAWVQGNTTFPYPMHLGDALLNDQLCILGYDD